MISSREQYLEHLRNSNEPSIRYTIARFVDLQDPDNPKMLELQDRIKNSDIVKTLLSGLNTQHPYKKWQGAHWILSLLAELHYPEKDNELIPLMEQVYSWLFSKEHLNSIRTIQGKVRRCASQEGNALYFSISLGLSDKEKTEALVDRLIQYQWDDGGWNCDKSPTARHSSYNESLIPLRGIIHYLKKNSDLPLSRKNQVKDAINRAVDVFLKRHLYIHQSTGEEILWKNRISFTKLHFPYYWRYNILLALKVMNEGGFLKDSRCVKALDLVASKELPEGGFPAEIKYYYSKSASTGSSLVNWGGVNKNKPNIWISSEAYSILNAAGYL